MSSESTKRSTTKILAFGRRHSLPANVTFELGELVADVTQDIAMEVINTVFEKVEGRQ